MAPRRKNNDGSYRRSKFCNLNCRDGYSMKYGKGFSAKEIICAHCGKSFVAKGATSSGNRLYCSHRCYGLSKRGKMSGDRNPSYIDGSTPVANTRVKNARWKEIAKEIRERDYDTCQRCDVRGYSFPVHHIIPYRISEDNSPNNLVTLCSNCHGWADTHLEESIKFFTKEEKR